MPCQTAELQNILCIGVVQELLDIESTSSEPLCSTTGLVGNKYRDCQTKLTSAKPSSLPYRPSLVVGIFKREKNGTVYAVLSLYLCVDS
jgi:hypothetical protein